MATIKTIILISLIALAISTTDKEQYEKQAKEADYNTLKYEESQEFMNTYGKQFHNNENSSEDSDPSKWDGKVGMKAGSFGFKAKESDIFFNAFDLRQDHGQCFADAVKDQKKCAASWAFAVTNTLEIANCIALDLYVNNPLSPQNMISCIPGGGCQEEFDLLDAWSYAENYGLYPEHGFPYVSQRGAIPRCPEDFKNKPDFQKVKSSNQETHRAKKLDPKVNKVHMFEEVARHIKHNKTPVTAAIKIYDDFFHNKGSYYKKGEKANFEGKYYVTLVGYSKRDENNKVYFTALTSLGSKFGDNGYVKIEMNDADIDLSQELVLGFSYWTGEDAQ